MMYTELVTIILGICLLLYMLLGGADFGAGIIEIFIGRKGKDTISRAMAPVWEANHMWLVIAIVILFNGFPKAYVILSTNLHIPVLMFLLGIVLRGTAFTFRHYDAYKDKSQRFYSFIFRFSSFFTVFFLGVILSAFLGGTIPNSTSGSYMEIYILPWFNLFSISVGFFLTILSAYIAAIFLMGEAETEEGYAFLQRFTIRLFLLSAVSGVLIMVSSFIEDLQFHGLFLSEPFTLLCVLVATTLVPLIFHFIRKKKTWSLRITVGFQISIIMLAWFFIQWPNFFYFQDGSTLSIYDAASPKASMKILFNALAVGVVIIFPGLYYLFKIFKT